MSDIFISYARATSSQARQIAEALRALGYDVWSDDELPAHRDYSEVIEERLRAAKAVVVVWCAEAAKSQWVRAEADFAREAGTMVQLTLDGAPLPMPFNRVQCADMAGWTGDADHPGWRKVTASVGELVGSGPPASTASTPPPLPSKPSIAVMPFANLSGDPEQEYFTDGMVVEITNALCRSKAIFVIASSSTLTFKGRGVGAQEVARQLGVRYVLEGSVRRAANRVRIAVQLVDASGGAQIWAQRFDETLDDVFDLQDKVAVSVAGVIGPAVVEAEIRRISARPTDNLGSYDLYLRACGVIRTFTRASALEALDLARQAVALDANFGAALNFVSSCRFFLSLFGWADDPEANRREAIEMAHRALAAAGDDADIVAECAETIGGVGGDLAAAVALADRAVALNPGSAHAWRHSGMVRLFAGDPDMAVAHLEASMRLDPVGPDRTMQMIGLSSARFQQGRYEAAAALAREVVQHTDNPGPYAILAASCGHLGQIPAAREALRRYEMLAGQSASLLGGSLLHRVPGFTEGIALAQGGGATRLDGDAPIS